jgi:hypothetical protein
MVLFTQPLGGDAFLGCAGWAIGTHLFTQYVADGLVDTYYAKFRAQCRATRSLGSEYDYRVVDLLNRQEDSPLKMDRGTAPEGIGQQVGVVYRS